MEGITRQELYQKTREDLLKRQLSNNENFDRSILTLSSAALALSVTFLRSSTMHNCFPILLFAWIGFLAAIVFTLISFLVSQQAISLQLENAEQYYLKNDDGAIEKKNPAAIWTDRLAYASAIAFAFAIIFLLIFFANNLPHKKESLSMSKEKKSETVNLMEGESVPKMQNVDAGASVPKMQIATPNSKGEVAPAKPIQDSSQLPPGESNQPKD